ncbi:hypothetical protein E2C01_049235 [Portunus trituberculatus]|uniref:Uncharacterized protein n=1 Tax=Portunus trituberculatus TaxID=210409 RepID=A0A5B7GDD7_PORTR|nr:hypothetical protein [Portunus trituberculatus]
MQLFMVQFACNYYITLCNSHIHIPLYFSFLKTQPDGPFK